MIILPAIDLLGGRCVRLMQGDYLSKRVYDEDPAAMAARFRDAGAKWLHVVNLDGARGGALGTRTSVWKGQLTTATPLSGPPQVNDEALASIIKTAGKDMAIEVGGGVRETEDVVRLLGMGVQRVIVGTRAIRDPAWLVELTGRFPDKIALSIDVHKRMLAIHGWTDVAWKLHTAQDLGEPPLEQWARHKIQQLLGDARPAAIIYTDIAKDGMMSGPNVEATAEVVKASPFPVIASGGVTTVEDVRRLKDVGVHGAIIGRALYEGAMTLEAALAAARDG